MGYLMWASQQSYLADIIIISILQMGKLKLRKVN